ncbi:Cerato-platanin [Trametes coccinea BRFM310]|uniref:Cerato-platanin n=1 Tax=Trametes coccinea (strain BRFM310) TaxID=1353009 RepID=A0A1Y2ILU9_TRAC3|nr:Cerato-platanin [Trametes coccinea BRFM310]
MKFASLAIALVAVPAALCAPSTVSVSWDDVYDNASGSLTTVACSDGDNGMITKGFTTFGSLPTFPNIGGAPSITGWNSDQCGTCWALTANNVTLHVLAIDTGGKGFNIALSAMDKLTNGTARQVGRINATATQVNTTLCGLKA